MIEIIRRYEWAAAHRLTRHRGKCKNLHGHQYTVELTLAAEVQPDGMILDFGIVDDAFGAFIKDEIDHSTMVMRADPLPIIPMLEGAGLRCHVVDFETSAENLAAYLLSVARLRLAAYGVEVLRARVWETPRGSAVAS